MNLSIYFISAALGCVAWAIMSLVLLTKYLDQKKPLSLSLEL